MLLSKILVFFRSCATVCLLCAGRRTTAGSCRWGTGSWSSPAPSGWREPCWYTIKALFTGFHDRSLLLLPVGNSWYTIKAHLTGITAWDAGFEPVTSLYLLDTKLWTRPCNTWIWTHDRYTFLHRVTTVIYLFYPIALQLVADIFLQYCTVHPPTL